MTKQVMRAQPVSEKKMPTDWLAAASSLSSLIEKEVPVSEADRTMSPAVVDALRETGLFWMLAPTEVGGGGCGYRELIEVIEELSRADASVGWSFMANSECIAAAGAYCGDTAIDAMFGGSEKPIVAGMFGPGGKARRNGDGYQVSGKFSYGSGCGHANWFGAGMMLEENGTIKQLAHGPHVQVCFIPREKVQVHDGWHVAGLSATGSFDYEIPDQLVQEDFSMERVTAVPRRGAALFNLGFQPIVAAGHCGVVLGTMKRALQEIARVAGEKKRVGYPGLVGDYPTVMSEFSHHEASYMAARGYVLEVFNEAEAAAIAGKAITPYQQARFRQVTSWVHKIAADVVSACYTASSSEGFRGSTAIGRAFRDTFVATNHLYVDPVHLVHSASAIMDHYRDGCPPAPTE